MIVTMTEAMAITIENSRRERINAQGTIVTDKMKRQHHALQGHAFKDDTRLSDLAGMIDTNARALSQRLHFPEKQIAKILQYWAKRAPIDEREDLVQTLTIKLLDESPESIKLAFCIMKRDTIDFMRKFYTYDKSKLSIDTPTSENTTIGDMIPDSFEFSTVVDLKLDTAKLLHDMGSEVSAIVGRKLSGVKLTNGEKAKLEAFAKKHLDFVCA